MAQFHNTPTARHPGRDNTLTLISQHYWWLGMNTWYIAGCTHCQQNKIHTTKKKAPLYCIPGNPSMCPFNVITLDLITQLPKVNEHDAILTIVDQGCSRAAIFIPCNTTITREGVALLYLKHLLPWFGVPSNRDPCFTSHFAQALTTKLGIGQNISTAFHPQMDRLTEHKNQWVEQYLCLYTSARQDNWDTWLPIATFVHNHWPNATIKHSPHEILLGYWPSAAEEPIFITNNETVEARHQLIKQHREAALQALNNVVQITPRSQYNIGDWVWLKAKHLTLPYASAKLAPKCHGPFQITKEIYPVAYQLKLPRAWTIHDIFPCSLLTPYKETQEHEAQFQCPPPELIGNEEEYEVEQIINHRHHGKWCQLQYLIWWKGYSAADNTWEPADQVRATSLTAPLTNNDMSSASSANIPSPTPSSFSINPATFGMPPSCTQHPGTLVLYWQEPLNIPDQVVAISEQLSTFCLPPWTICAALEGHNPDRDQLLLITQGLDGVVQKNEANAWQNCEQLEILWQQGEALAKHEVHTTVLEATYLHWKEDGNKRLTDDDIPKTPKDFEENKGKVSNFYIPVTDGSHTIHVLAPYILLDGQYCLRTWEKGEPIYRQELFAPQHYWWAGGVPPVVLQCVGQPLQLWHHGGPLTGAWGLGDHSWVPSLLWPHHQPHKSGSRTSSTASSHWCPANSWGAMPLTPPWVSCVQKLCNLLTPSRGPLPQEQPKRQVLIHPQQHSSWCNLILEGG